MTPDRLDRARGEAGAVTATAVNPLMTDRADTGGPAAPVPPVRLSLVPAGSTPARLDGAWWPRSRDLTAELPPLTAVLDARWERITRVTVNPTHWPAIPRKVPVAGHDVHVGWFKEEQDPHQLMLVSFRVGRWDLLVIPPGTPAAMARWLMAAAADPLRTSTGSQLIEEAWRRDGATPPVPPARSAPAEPEPVHALVPDAVPDAAAVPDAVAVAVPGAVAGPAGGVVLGLGDTFETGK
jgi:hypothetical protein